MVGSRRFGWAFAMSAFRESCLVRCTIESERSTQLDYADEPSQRRVSHVLGVKTARMALYFEDINPGPLGVSKEWFDLIAADTVAFAQQWDPQPFHVDEDAAKQSIYGGLTASGCHLICVSNLLWKQIESPAVIGLLAQTFQFPRAARPGDRLILRAEVLEKRPSESKPDRGIVKLRAKLEDEAGSVVLIEESTVLVTKRPHAG